MSRKEKAILTKKKLFDSAVTLMKEQGYDHVTISEICKKAGVAKGTFYVHYQSKEDIVKESYYSDMSQFVLQIYKKRTTEEQNMTIKNKIRVFLLSEFLFAEYTGCPMTCRAYVTNLSESISGDSNHFKRRDFSKILKNLIVEGINQKLFETDQTADSIFLYLESFVRGLMASWCFANAEFDIVKTGEKYLNKMLKNL